MFKNYSLSFLFPFFLAIFVLVPQSVASSLEETGCKEDPETDTGYSYCRIKVDEVLQIDQCEGEERWVINEGSIDIFVPMKSCIEYVEWKIHVAGLQERGFYVCDSWLSDWDKRVKITIDAGDIDDDLTWFPVLLKLGTSVGINSEDVSFIFDELDAGSNQGSYPNRKKIAVTDDSENTELYCEIEKWDDNSDAGNKQAWLWVSKDGWEISSSTNTDLYFYYDSSHADNDVHVGDTDDAVAENVWDSNFKFVSHMRDDPDYSSIRDSTSNDNDGTKHGVNQPIATTSGKINGAQDFNGTDDDISLALDPTTELGQTITLEAQVYPHVQSAPKGIMGWSAIIGGWGHGLMCWQCTGAGWLFGYGPGGYWQTNGNMALLTLNAWAYLAGTIQTGTGGNINVFKDGAQVGSPVSVSLNIAHLSAFYIGTYFSGGIDRHFDGLIDEVRVSDIVRSAAWIKATYETSRDNLLDWEW